MNAAQQAITANAAGLAEARAHLQQVVDQARADGVTWAEVGEALGISRQAAWERFAAVPVDFLLDQADRASAS